MPTHSRFTRLFKDILRIFSQSGGILRCDDIYVIIKIDNISTLHYSVHISILQIILNLHIAKMLILNKLQN